jgi:hypothetical protein
LGNDTLISGKTCQRYLIKKHQFFSQPGGVFVEGPIIDIAKKYTHTSRDTVFHYQNNQFYTLFNFGANIGDQWIIDDEYQMTGCDLESIVEVVDIDINGTFRRAIHLETLDGSPLKMNGWIVENIGPIGDQYLFPTNIRAPLKENLQLFTLQFQKRNHLIIKLNWLFHIHNVTTIFNDM